MSIAHRLSEKLEQPDVQARLLPLTTAQSLAGMVLVALEVGLMIARWVLENELARRIKRQLFWPVRVNYFGRFLSSAKARCLAVC